MKRHGYGNSMGARPSGVRSRPRVAGGGNEYGHKGTMGTGTVKPVARGTMGSGEVEPQAKGVQGRG